MLKLFHLQNVYLKLKYLDTVLKPERYTPDRTMFEYFNPSNDLSTHDNYLISLIPNQITLTASMHV